MIPPPAPASCRSAEAGAGRLKVRLHVLEVRVPEDLPGVVGKAGSWRAAAPSRHRETALRAPQWNSASRPSFPTARTWRRGGSCSMDQTSENYGAKPADLPVEQPTKPTDEALGRRVCDSPGRNESERTGYSFSMGAGHAAAHKAAGRGT